ncbi:hypothetical protein LCGC14_0699230 [marine sediment metagenome]|uniref:Helix-turn-helix domain-containing protein n=1 Tax=marine sediment metagenome TaxID=412755 RepID=A0A0F9T4B0_9ZZZZ
MSQVIEGEFYLTVDEAADRLGKSPETVRKWIRGNVRSMTGRLPARKMGFQYFIREVDVEAEAVRKEKGL